MPSKKPAPKKTVKTVAKPSKPAAKPASPAKKAVPATKAVPAKKAAPVAKAAPAKKVVAKPQPKAVIKPVAKKVVAKAVPVKKAAPVKVAPVKAAPSKKVETVVQHKVAAKPAAKPEPKPVSKPVSKIPEKPLAKSTTNTATKPAPAPVPTPAPAPVQKAKAPVVKAAPQPSAKPVKKTPEPIKDIKIPKTLVKSSVPYKPHYTPLEKREDEKTGLNQTLVKYSDQDLADFRELITKKLEAAKKELAYLQGLITRKDEMGGDNDDARYMTMEDGSMSMEREQLSQMASRQITYIDHLEKAIMRIENKTYGICRVTGKLIDKARLRAVPHATLSLEAKLGLVRHSAE
jgi:RNA polymerase-binding transcription factor DksA